MALKNNPAFKFFKEETKKPEPPKLIQPKPKKSLEEPCRRPSLDKHTEELLFQNFLELEKVKRRGSHLTEIEHLENIERFQNLREEKEEEEKAYEKRSNTKEDEGE
ncbi:unnamed protein product, partial [Meganyctiphanes norvegica]